MNKLKTIVKDICKEGGLVGKYTNHSLRATCASRMYNNQVPEQIIKEVTGHRSEAVRIYKCTSDKLREDASNTLSNDVNVGGEKSVKIEESEVNETVESNVCVGE